MRGAGAIAIEPGASAPGRLRGQAFDLGFIVGVTVPALALGIDMARDSRLFGPILYAAAGAGATPW